MVIEITVPLKPHGQMRAKHDHRNKRTYKTNKQSKAEEDYLRYIVPYAPPTPLEGELALRVSAFYPIPKSWTVKKKQLALSGAMRPAVTPDLSNVVKHIEDICNGVLWGDDRQVVEYIPGTGRWYSERPRVEITVAPVLRAEELSPHSELSRRKNSKKHPGGETLDERTTARFTGSGSG